MKNAFKIQIGIKMPRGGQGGHNRVYPWDELRPGESFFVPGREGEALSVARSRLSASAAAAGARRGRVYRARVRRAEKHGEHGIRVWRVK